ncbi:MAG: NADH-quinone oxidoreductase subunit N [Phycisphaerae bacterium]
MNESLLLLLAPEATLVAGALLVLLIGLARREAVRACSFLVAFLSAAAALAIAWTAGPLDRPIHAFGVELTSLSWYVRLTALGIGLVVLLVHHHLPQEEQRGEIFGMILFSLTGIMLTTMADDLVLLFLAVELVSVPTYILVSMGRSHIHAQEAGLKYFFLGALAAALLAYGLSFLYGVSGDTCLSRMNLDGNHAYVVIGMVLAFSGIAFKIAAVPFHVYAADVYQGSAAPTAGLLGFFPKVAGLMALIKLLMLIQPRASGPLGWEIPDIAFAFLWIVAATTMIVGNVLALWQTNVKRILAYSSIAHSGYMLVAVLAGPVAGGGPLRNGLSAMLFYITIYGLMNLGAFAVLSLTRADGRELEELDDLAGLSRHHPLAAFSLAICVFSLMGLPPTAGFLGKLYIFSSALSADPNHPHRLALIALAVIGIINAAIAAAYYLRIVAACYLCPPQHEFALVTRSRPLQFGVLCCCLAILLIGLWPAPLLRMSGQPFLDPRPPSMLVRTTSPSQPQPPSRQHLITPDTADPHRR